MKKCEKLREKALLKAELDKLALKENSKEGLEKFPDPLQIAKPKKDAYIALMCTLFSYGSSKNIVKFLKTLDFSLIDKSENEIKKAMKNLKYRFQNEEDITQIFITFARLKNKYKNLEEIFTEPYKKSGKVSDGILNFIKIVYEINPCKSKGYTHFFGSTWQDEPKSPLKRYNMFLRWMVRKDELDMGLWRGISPADLLIPLDTHTQKISLKHGLLTRKSYDFKAVLELTQNLKKLDPKDPIKYDFALYRLGQNGS